MDARKIRALQVLSAFISYSFAIKANWAFIAALGHFNLRDDLRVCSHLAVAILRHRVPTGYQTCWISNMLDIQLEAATHSRAAGEPSASVFNCSH